jgi:hypothetical protein
MRQTDFYLCGLYYTWCDYEVHGIILLRELKGAKPLDRNEDTYVRISTCTIYDFNTLTPVEWKVWRW